MPFITFSVSCFFEFSGFSETASVVGAAVSPVFSIVSLRLEWAVLSKIFWTTENDVTFSAFSPSTDGWSALKKSQDHYKGGLNQLVYELVPEREYGSWVLYTKELSSV